MVHGPYKKKIIKISKFKTPRFESLLLRQTPPERDEGSGCRREPHASGCRHASARRLIPLSIRACIM